MHFQIVRIIRTWNLACRFRWKLKCCWCWWRWWKMNVDDGSGDVYKINSVVTPWGFLLSSLIVPWVAFLALTPFVPISILFALNFCNGRTMTMMRMYYSLSGVCRNSRSWPFQELPVSHSCYKKLKEQFLFPPKIWKLAAELFLFTFQNSFLFSPAPSAIQNMKISKMMVMVMVMVVVMYIHILNSVVAQQLFIYDDEEKVNADD